MITIATIAETFNTFNAEFFNNSLPTPRFEIGKRKHAWGSFTPGRMILTVSNYYDRTLYDYQKTILHEMIHEYQWVTYHKCDHLWSFKSKANEIYVKSKGKWDITRCTGMSEGTTIDNSKLKSCYLLIAREGNSYVVGKLCQDPVKANEVATWVKKMYYRDAKIYIGKGLEFERLSASRSRFNYRTYSLNDFEDKVKPNLLREVA